MEERHAAEAAQALRRAGLPCGGPLRQEAHRRGALLLAQAGPSSSSSSSIFFFFLDSRGRRSEGARNHPEGGRRRQVEGAPAVRYRVRVCALREQLQPDLHRAHPAAQWLRVNMMRRRAGQRSPALANRCERVFLCDDICDDEGVQARGRQQASQRDLRAAEAHRSRTGKEQETERSAIIRRRNKVQCNGQCNEQCDGIVCEHCACEESGVRRDPAAAVRRPIAARRPAATARPWRRSP